jgi:hypothetical protein
MVANSITDCKVKLLLMGGHDLATYNVATGDDAHQSRRT